MQKLRLPLLGLILCTGTTCADSTPAPAPVAAIAAAHADVALAADLETIEARVPRNATLQSLLTRHMSSDLAGTVAAAARSVFDPRQMRADNPYRLVRSIGVSNYSTAQIDDLTEATGVTPVVNQIKWSPAIYDAVRFGQLSERDVVLEGYSPFRAGDLADPELVQIAQEHGVTPAQVVLRWHVEHGIVVIPKSARPERIESNLDIFGFSLSDDEMARLDGLAG